MRCRAAWLAVIGFHVSSLPGSGQKSKELTVGRMRRRPVQPACWFERNGQGKRKMKRRSGGEGRRRDTGEQGGSEQRRRWHGERHKGRENRVGGGEDGKAANARQKGEAARKKDVRPVQF